MLANQIHTSFPNILCFSILCLAKGKKRERMGWEGGEGRDGIGRERKRRGGKGSGGKG